VAAPGSQPTADPSPEVAGRVGLSWVPARLLFGRALQSIPADFFRRATRTRWLPAPAPQPRRPPVRGCRIPMLVTMV